MLKLFFLLLILLNISVLHGKGTKIQVLLINSTWLKADLINADPEGNLTIRLKDTKRILRRKEFRIVKMALPLEMQKAEQLLNKNMPREAGKLLRAVDGKYNFPPIRAKIKVMEAQVKIAEADSRSAVFVLEPLLKDKMVMPELEAPVYAHGFLMLGNAYQRLKQENKAIKAYRRSFELAVPEYSAIANLDLGKLFLKQKNTRGALDCFLENILVFPPGTPGHKLSLEETIAFYKKDKDKKFKLYEDMLKKNYPQMPNNGKVDK